MLISCVFHTTVAVLTFQHLAEAATGFERTDSSVAHLLASKSEGQAVIV